MKFENFAFLEFLKKVKQKFWALGLIPQQVIQLYPRFQDCGLKVKSEAKTLDGGLRFPMSFKNIHYLPILSTYFASHGMSGVTLS
jgi:hypothetical protein